LKKWAEVIGHCRAEEVFAYFNNDYQAHAVFNALRLKELLTGSPTEKGIPPD